MFLHPQGKERRTQVQSFIDHSVVGQAIARLAIGIHMYCDVGWEKKTSNTQPHDVHYFLTSESIPTVKDDQTLVTLYETILVISVLLVSNYPKPKCPFKNQSS